MCGTDGATFPYTARSGDFSLYGFTVEFNRVGLIRLGKGQHAVWMHSALPRLGFIPLGCRTGGRAWNTWQTTAKWKPYTGSEGLEGVGSESDPE